MAEHRNTFIRLATMTQPKPLSKLIPPNQNLNSMTSLDPKSNRESCLILANSPHQICHKNSPANKRVVMIPQQKIIRVLSPRDNEQSFDMANSKISIINSHIIQNVSRIEQSFISPSSRSKEKRAIRINFINKTPEGSRTSSTHIRQLKPSPTKTILYKELLTCHKENPLGPKLKMLEQRITDLHQEKHDIALRFGEENKRLQHQNLFLKQQTIKLTELLEIKQKVDRIQLDQNVTKCEKSQELSLSEKSIEIQQENNYQQQIIDLQNQLEKQIVNKLQIVQESQNLMKTIEEWKKKLIESQSKNKDMIEKISKMSRRMEILQKENNESINSNELEKDLNSIKRQMLENAQRNAEIQQTYESKLNELKKSNKQLIDEIQSLRVTIIALQEQKHQVEQRMLEAENCPNSISLEEQCQLFQANLVEVIKQKDFIIEEKAESIHQMQVQLTVIQDHLGDKEKIVLEMGQKNQYMREKLTQCLDSLQQYAFKVEEMNAKYQEMTDKYQSKEAEIQAIQSSRVSEKKDCKKCEDLLKTVFKLNGYLHSKK